MSLRARAARRGNPFESLDPEAMEALLSSATEEHFKAGALMLRQGDPGDVLYVVIDGYAEVSKHLADGRELTLAHCGPGDYFGERALLPGRPPVRSADVRAKTPVTVARVTRESFQALLDGDHPLKKRMLEVSDKQLLHDLALESELLGALQLHAGEPLNERSLTAGEQLFAQGDVADALYLVLTGAMGVYVDGEEQPRAILTPGQCLGELGLMYQAPRSATARAVEPTRLATLPAQRFAALREQSQELQELFTTLQRVYRLPHRGLVTRHHGSYQGQGAVSHLFELPGERMVVSSRVVGQELYNADEAHCETARTLRFVDPARGLRRELRLNHASELVGLTVHGVWGGLAELQRRLLERVPLEPELLDGFEGSGELNFEGARGADQAQLCSCVPTSHSEVSAAIQGGCTGLSQLQDKLGCGTVCGACVPGLQQELGDEGWTPVRVVSRDALAPNIQRFRLEPLGDEGMLSFLPGQHVVVSGLVGGEWVQRPYTLSSACLGEDTYEIVVKREPEGLFSRWLCDQSGPDTLLRISPPRGEYFWQAAGRPAVCIVAGIGVTPALAMMRARVRQGWSAPLHVDYSVREQAQAVAEVEFDQTAQQEPGMSFKLRVTSEDGRLTQQDIDQLPEQFPDAEYFLCGPNAFMEQVLGMLGEARVRPQFIFIESFSPADATAPPRGHGSEDPAPTGFMGKLRALFGL